MATYKVIGRRYLRKYTAEGETPVYAAATDAARVAAELCDVPWEASAVRQAELPLHGDDEAPSKRERYDAALFCAGHSGDRHRAYANATVYRYALPDAAVGKTLASLAVKVTSDPYNAAGCRLHVFTNATGAIPTACADVRGNGADGEPLEDGTVAAAFAPREAKAVSGKTYWYPVTATATLSPTGGLALQKYLFLAVALESYSTVRGNWLEGSAFADNLAALTVSEGVTGWADGAEYDLSGDAETAFKVVEGGVLADLPSTSASPVRSLTLQRTGDAFALATASASSSSSSAADALYSRTPVYGIRTLDLGADGGAAFGTPLVSGLATGVSVFPAFKNLYYKKVTTGGTTTKAETNSKFTFVSGSFDKARIQGLNGALMINTDLSAGTNACPTNLGLPDTAFATDADRTKWAAALQAVSDDGGIGGLVELMLRDSSVSDFIFLHTRKRAFLLSSGYGNVASLKWDTSAVSSITVNDGTWTDPGGEPFYMPAFGSVELPVSGATVTADLCFPVLFVHKASERKIWGPSKSAWSVTYAGTVTAIRPMIVRESEGFVAFIMSGDLESVGGVACSNCAVVKFASSGSVTVTVPECDAAITPNGYRNFAVSQPVYGNGVYRTDEFYVTGGFTRLGGLACEICAHVKGTAVYPVALPEGTRPPEYFLACDAAGETPGSSAFWVDDTDFSSKADSGSSSGSSSVSVYAAPKAAVTDAQSAFGLRRLYSNVYAGLPSRTVSTSARIGAAFRVSGASISVRTGTGDSDVTSAKCWNASEAALAVPFSCPQDFSARKVRLEWGATAATAGSCVRVWLRRGEFIEGMPASVPTSLHFAAEAGATVDGWEYVGTATPADGTAGEATFEVDPLTDRQATLLFVAFVGQDDFNPSADMTLPRGVGTLDVNEVAGTESGLDGGFLPDVTLIG